VRVRAKQQTPRLSADWVGAPNLRINRTVLRNVFKDAAFTMEITDATIDFIASKLYLFFPVGTLKRTF